MQQGLSRPGSLSPTSPGLLLSHTYSRTHTVYRCSNCHVTTVPCSTCEHGTRLQTRSSERPWSWGGRRGGHEADAFEGPWGGGASASGPGGKRAESGGETKAMSSKRCIACVSGKEWSELERHHREQSTIIASNPLAPKPKSLTSIVAMRSTQPQCLSRFT